MAAVFWIFVLWATRVKVAGELSSCLTDPIPENARNNITIDGQSLPLGLWVHDWDSAAVVTEVMKILVEETLGYHVVIGPAGTSSDKGIHALAGCPNGEDCSDGFLQQGSQPVSSRWHLVFETWTSAESALRTWEDKVPERVPERLGTMGYAGSSGHFVQQAVFIAALNTEGLSLDWYRNFNALA